MRTAAAYLDAGMAIVKRDLTLMLTYRTRVVTQLLGPIFSLLIFYYIAQLVKVESFPSPESYFGFVVIGLVIAQVLQSALTGPMLIRQELVAGTFERLLLSPLGPVGSMISMLIFPLLNACLIATTTLLIASIAFGMEVAWPQALLAFPVALAGAAAFAAMALFFVSSMVVFKQVSGMTWVTAAITVVSGVYFPLALLPGWLEWAANAQPFTSTVDLLRHLLIGTPLQQSALVELAKLAGFLVILLPSGIASLSFAIRVSRRRGTIIEY